MPPATDVRNLLLRPMRLDDQPAAILAQEELQRDEFTFLLEDFRADEPWTDYLARLERTRRGIGLASDRVPASFLVADVDGSLVGRVSIRHELNGFLAMWGGHIGYGVRPAFRRRGYATAILRQSLVLARGLGISSALVVCDDDNTGSARVIEACGGVFDQVVTGKDGGHEMRHYWIDTEDVAG
jgi:predicted acetyltransferase